MNICIVAPGGLDPHREDRRIPCLQWLVERMVRDHDVSVFALQQSSESEVCDFSGARVYGVRNRSILGVVRLILRSHRRSRFDVVQAFWASRPGVVAVVSGRVMRRPVFVHVSGGELVSLSDIDYGTARTWKGRAAVRTVLRHATGVTAASSGMINSVRAVGGLARCVPLGVDLDRWPATEPPEVAEAPYRLIHVASLNRVKNQGTLLRAMAKLCSTDFPFHLDVIGEDTLNGELQRQAARLRLTDFVTFHGWLPQQDVRRLMSQAHLNLVTSRHEAGPIVAREAAACGVMTLGSPVGHIADWEPHGAIAVDVSDSVAFANAIKTLLRDDEHRVRVSKTAQEDVVTRDVEWTVREFESLYREAGAG